MLLQHAAQLDWTIFVQSWALFILLAEAMGTGSVGYARATAVATS